VDGGLIGAFIAFDVNTGAGPWFAVLAYRAFFLLAAHDPRHDRLSSAAQDRQGYGVPREHDKAARRAPP